jgi:hypothetical protein
VWVVVAQRRVEAIRRCRGVPHRSNAPGGGARGLERRSAAAPVIVVQTITDSERFRAAVGPAIEEIASSITFEKHVPERGRLRGRFASGNWGDR